MAGWDVLQNSSSSRRDFMSLYGNDLSASYRLMMEVPSTISSIHYSMASSANCDENTFCTLDNIDQCISYLNQELPNLGFNLLSYESQNKLTSVINCLYDVLRIYQRNVRIKDELENRVHRTTSELDHCQSTNTRLKTDKEKVLREIAKEQEKYRQVVVKQKSLSAKLKAEKDETKRLQSVIKDRDIQFKHEVKKRERETNKLKERLHQLLIDKTPNRRVGLDIANSLQRTDGKRSTWKGTSNNKQEEMYQAIIGNYEEKQRELMLENTDLRDCLMHMQKELVSVMNRPESSHSLHVNSNSINSSTSINSDGDESYSSHTTLDEFSDGYFQMPYDIMKDNIQKSFRETCKKLKENIKRGRQPSPSSSTLRTSPSKLLTATGKTQIEEEIEKLKKQIKKYKEIVKQQEELIHQSIQCQSKSVENSFLHESQLLEEKESLAEQRKLFYQEKSNFEEERRQFTEAAIRLGRERKVFEEERATVLKNQFLQMSPFGSSSSQKHDTPLKGEKARLLPSTPLFSPAPSGKPKTPSTHELYRFLGITPKDVGSRRSRDSTPAERKDKDNNMKKILSSESLLSGSCNSEPCGTKETQSSGSRSSVGSRRSTGTKDILDNYIEARRTLFRRSSTGSNDGLNV